MSFEIKSITNINEGIEEILITHEELIKRIEEVGKEISKDYVGKNPLLIALLKGSVPFLSELLNSIYIPMEYECVKVSSYCGTKSTGCVTIEGLNKLSIENRNLIIIEDIVDSGLTIQKTIEALNEYHPASIEVATLLDKPSMRQIENIHPKYICFKIPNKFVVGFGLDFNQQFRNLPYVGVLKPTMYME